ncbi:hypothetical protein LOTGIDRAFT_227874 [Lottia gigantea]|uniref:Chitin-binding type-2 domain-containing protein n=1 Tax=Lottia gigantea TaxID=225164 RepID=V4BC42_LOTGI|nr:hypothetical protein LOTGIDRAFT_227874 [Lottia gigantea]ESP05206.1 hypothetical protein LOTGIDRAFT_227874 [Lottia gigantea]
MNRLGNLLIFTSILVFIISVSGTGDRCSYTCYYTEKTRGKCSAWSWNLCTKYRYASKLCYTGCVHGGWSEWDQSLGPCSVSCGDGFQDVNERRECNNPAPANGGNNCEGDDERTSSQSCSEDPCPVNGGWGEWSEWMDTSECDVVCATGSKGQSRTRDCDNPEPSGGGEDCIGDSNESRTIDCNTFSCNDLCVDDVHYIPHRDITKFWQCSNGVAYEMSCPKGTYWNKEIPVCDHITK